MSDPRTSRAERLLDLVSFFLAADRQVAWEEIRAAFPTYQGENEASCLRKFERDKAELVEIGLPLEWVPPQGGEAGGYQIDRERYYLPDLDLGAEERALLSLAGAAALEQPAFPLRDELVRALDKLFFSSSLRLRMAREPLLEGEAAHLETIGRAAAENRDLALAYRSYEGVRSERRLSPYGLAFRSGAWFVVGFCHLREALRTFAVERIEAAELLGTTFQVPAGFDVRAHVGLQGWELGRHAPREVVIEVAPEALPLARRLFEGAAREGGRFTLRATHEEALVPLVLRLAPHARVLAPAALGERVRETARRIAARHEGEALRPVGATPALAAAEPRPQQAPELHARLQRALLLIPRAVARSGCTVAELAAEMRLSEPALLAEIDFLRMVGKPPFSPADLVDIDVSDGRVHASLPQGFSRPPALTPLEAVALDAAASAFAEEGGARLEKVRERLRRAIPADLRRRFDALSGRIRMEALGLDAESAARLDRAIEEQREISFAYFSAARGEAAERRVRPLKRLVHQGYWYLYAYCCDRRDRRLFRLDRASGIRLEAARFIPRPLDEVPLGPLQSERMALLRVDPGPFAQPGYLWRLGAREVELLPDGGALARLPLAGEAYLVSAVLSMGGRGEVVEPADLRARVRAIARP